MDSFWNLEAPYDLEEILADGDFVPKENGDFFLFGDLDLEPLEVRGVSVETLGGLDEDRTGLSGLSLKEGAAKRTRPEHFSDEQPASNKMAHMEPGDPVPLPAYGQNLFEGKDLSVAQEARAVESLLRSQVDECARLRVDEEAEAKSDQLRQAIVARKEWTKVIFGQEMWKPGTLAVFSQLLLLLTELEAMLDVCNAKRLGNPPSEQGRLLIMHDELGCPVFLKDSIGFVSLKIIVAPYLRLIWPPKDIVV